MSGFAISRYVICNSPAHSMRILAASVAPTFFALKGIWEKIKYFKFSMKISKKSN